MVIVVGAALIFLRVAAALATTRRQFAATFAAAPLALRPPQAHGAVADSVDKLTAVKAALAPLPPVLDRQEWDKVRTVLKTSPVAELWNQGNSKNYARAEALDLGDPELIELIEDLSSALQLTDQYVYDNNFIYFQPGNGKVKTKEPMDQLKQAQRKLDQIIAALKEAT